jgi:2,5-dichloro-2,5-cyclohexadiene-1,4-diol dehydrogenase 1
VIDLTGRSVIITGAASGMGAAGARIAASAGADVTIADLSESAGNAVVDEITAAGGSAQFVRTDISVEADVEAMVGAAVDRFGRVDAAYNNAGLPPLSSARNGFFPLADLDASSFRRSLEVNVLGTFLCLKYEIRAMLESGGGAIVNTSSANGLVAIPGAPEYIASKHAIIGLTKAAALDYATQGIRVNAVLPGVIRTPMLTNAVDGDEAALESYTAVMPIGRLGLPEEVAEAALWLLTDAASLITGASLSVDGGQTMV